MSGALSWTPIQFPDWQQTQLRAQEMQQNRLRMMIAQRELQQNQQRSDWFEQNARGFASPDASKRMNLLSQLAAQPGGAQMALPMMQSLRDRMEADGTDQPGVAPSAMPSGGAAPTGGYYGRLFTEESGAADGSRVNGVPRLANGQAASSARGNGQFINGTWLDFAAANPGLFPGMTREQILATRDDPVRGPALGRQATRWYALQNAGELRAAGLPATDATVALAHRVGIGGATSVLRASPETPLASVLGAGAMTANPSWANLTVGQFRERFAHQYGAGSTYQGGEATQGGAQHAAASGAGGAPPGATRGGLQRAPNGEIIVPGYDPVAVARWRRMRGHNEIARENLTGYERALQAHMASQPPPPPNLQTIALGADAPQGAGIYAIENGQPTRRLAAAPADASAAPFARANQLRDEHTRISGDFRIVQSAYNNIRSAAASVTGQGDMAMLYSFIKMLDPNSAVREGEYATATQTGSVPQRIISAYNRAVSGDRLPDDMRAGFLQEAESIYRNNLSSYNRTAEHYRAMARRQGLDPDDVVVPFADPDAAGAARRTPPPVVPPPVPPPGGQTQAPPDPSAERLAQLQTLVGEARAALGAGATQADIEAYVRRRINGR